MSEAKTTSYLWLFWCLAIFTFGIDQASKYGTFHMLYVEPPHDVMRSGVGRLSLIPETFEFHVEHLWTPAGVVPRVNHGALFGLGQQTSGSNTAFAVISLAAAAAIVFWSTRRPARSDRLLCASLGLILGGTLGNMYDRVVFGGVRDFLHWYRWFEWPIFNLADSCLVCGAGLLLVHAFFVQPATNPTSEIAAPAEPHQMVNVQ